MKNTFNSGNQFWTEVALSGGWVEVLAAATNLSGLEQDRLNYIKSYGVANSAWKPWMIGQFTFLLKEMFTRYPGSAD